MKNPLQIRRSKKHQTGTHIKLMGIAGMLLCFPPIVQAATSYPITVEKHVAQKGWPVTGTVTDEQGLPLPGVTVKIEGTPTAVATDAAGAFSIEVNSENDVLSFSFIGYKTQSLKVGAVKTLNIKLGVEQSTLSEVVVTGYSSQSRRDITGAVTTVNAKDLKAVPASNFAQQLQGRAAGVQIGNEGSPGGNVMVRIRGIGSITGNSEPLYVIDGVPTQGDLNLINSDDVETIQILKDASTASIYGSRASNGVVIITTKKGKGEAKITFDNYFGVQVPKSFKTFITPQQNADILWQGLRNSGQVSPTTGNPVHPIYGSGENPVLPDYMIPAGAMEGDPRVDPANYSNNINDPAFGVSKFLITKTNKQGTDWYDVITDPALTQNYNLTVSGGNDKGHYAVTGSYLNQKGIIKYSSFKRYSLRVNTEFLVKKHIRLGENIQFVYADKVGVGSRGEFTPIGQVFTTAPLQPVYDIAGNFSGNRDFVIGGPNPLSGLERGKDNHGIAPRVFGNVFAEVDFLKDFKFRSSFGVDYSSYNFSNFYPLVYENYLAQPKIAVLDVGNSYGSTITWTNTLTYNKTFAENHRITGFVGIESVESKGRGFGAQKTGFNFEDLDYRYLDAGINLTNIYGNATPESALFSIFAKADYAFKDKYLLSALVRRDASSRFAASHRWGTFPAFSAGWRISQEDFIKDSKIFSDLKLRAGWGKTGNQEIDPYNQYNTYITSLNNSSYDIYGTSNSVVPGYRKFRIGNENARWEAQTMTNVGIDMSFLQNRLSFTIDAYRRNVSDLLLVIPIAATEGQNVAPAVNIGSMRNDGIDFEFTYRGTAAKGDFKYTINGNWSTYNNKVTGLYGVDNAFISGYGTRIGALTRTQVGHPISAFYGYQLDGIFQSQAEADAHPTQGGNRTLYNQEGRFKFRDVNGDNVIDDKDQTFIGSPIPDFTYGLNINLQYKAFDLSVFLQGVHGNDIFNYNRYFSDFFGLSYNYGPRMLDSWTTENRDAVLPKLNPNTASYESQASSYYLESGSYLRAKNVQLGYNFPTGLLNKIGVDRLRVYVQAQNLFTITKYTGLDPEVNLAAYGAGADRDIGVDRAIYPIPRTFLVGIQLGL